MDRRRATEILESQLPLIFSWSMVMLENIQVGEIVPILKKMSAEVQFVWDTL